MSGHMASSFAAVGSSRAWRCSARWMAASAARVAIDEPMLHREIAALEARAQSWGIAGVPAFVFERRYLVSGAQEPQAFLQVMDKLVAEGATTA